MEEIKKLTKIMAGIYTINADSDWYRENCECHVLALSGEYYLAYVDPDDGYRSYSAFKCLGNVLPNTVRITMSVPVDQDVYIKEYTECDYESYKDIAGTRIVNANTHKPILEIYTNYVDDYYPVGQVHYYPTELDANLNK